ncbi:hypothetical protein SMGD1_1433 [Sulfurimonas gotlandica GD1]|jgi:hypothetical protein|uniref:Uncharacterized protein n=1 Tax=Sulfurimonas gotlandica (strain DSM 19862 / JCM 16533 / GD1) TaxID=929558 RepID=B6BHG1_SULGG|nr:hypothetical protein [Sulfurimonas gotlandica]EDZ63009.1 conserved hypothetical protein [Sulfurimonas gotlandica GD1]EHP29957.1 hypothetical protein SMGD1_1433 [Sulfurimonas gotlandica GD1]
MSVKKGLIFGLLFGFLVLGILSMQRAMPQDKEERIYKAIKVYSPYKLEKRIGGLTIINSQTGIKEKPSAAEVLHRLDELNKEWGKNHIVIKDNDAIILGDNNQTVVKIFIETEKERTFLKNFYGI